MSLKPYQCEECGNETEEDTNHYGEFYPFCKVCQKQTVYKFTGELPKDAWIPEKWNKSTIKVHNEFMNSLNKSKLN